jgi:hypothetical protein
MQETCCLSEAKNLREQSRRDFKNLKRTKLINCPDNFRKIPPAKFKSCLLPALKETTMCKLHAKKISTRYLIG